MSVLYSALIFDARYDIGGSFRLKWLLNDGAPINPKLVGNRPFFRMIVVAYLGHVMLHTVAVLFCFRIVSFGRGLKLQK